MRLVTLQQSETWPLRQAVLRPHVAQDDIVPTPGAAHLGAADGGGRILAVGAVGPQGHPRDPRPGDWRVRGMATLPEARSQGAGGLVLAGLLAHVRRSGGRRVWCNARTPARRFYERHGFVAEGEEFQLPIIGPHFVMAVTLGP